MTEKKTDTTKNIYEALIAITNGVSHIGKSQQNTQQHYQFRGIDDVYNELHKHFAEHGVFITTEISNIEREERRTKNGGLLIYTIITAQFTFHAKDGSSVKSTLIGEAMDSGDKSCNKAMSTALKYALMQMFLIPTAEEKDTEHQSPKPAPKEKPKFTKEILEKMKESMIQGDYELPATMEELVEQLEKKYVVDKKILETLYNSNEK